MTTTEPTTVLGDYRDSSVLLLLDQLRLNRYDNKFISNIYKEYISNGRPLTERQSEVFDVIVKKYKKQLKKIDVNFEDILAQEWKNGFFSAEDIQNQSFFTIEDGIMKLHFKFDKKLIEQIRTFIYDDECKFLNRSIPNGTSSSFGEKERYDFFWDSAKHIWHGPFNVHLFRDLLKFCYRNEIRLDDSVDTLVYAREIDDGKKEDWTPQLHLVNDHLYVNCIAETMLDTLATFDLTDTSDINIENICNTLALVPLAVYGKDRKTLMTLVHNIYDTTEKVQQDELYNYLKEMNKRTVFLLPANVSNIFNFDNINNKFITELEMRDWDIPKSICVYGQATTPDRIQLDNYDTVVSTMDINALVHTSPEIGKFALNNKFIRIK